MANKQEAYDLIVIGGGPAGTPVAIEYAKLNKDKRIALIDSLGELGGECLFQGCIPSKIMGASAKHIQDLKSLKEFGVTLDNNHYQLTWKKIKQRKHDILSKRTGAAKILAESVGNIDIIKARASFESDSSIKVAYENGDSKIFNFDRAVIATGSRARIAQYTGDAVDRILTNEQFFSDMKLVKSLSIIGDGPIAIEFAQILSNLGVNINLFVWGDNILENIDKEASSYLLENLQKSSHINVLLNATVQEINHAKQGRLSINYEQNGELKNLVSDEILSAIGRIANLEHLNLEKAHVKWSNKGIVASKALQTTNKKVFANGDVVEGFPKFAHTAQYAAHILAQNLFLEHSFFKPSFNKNAWVLFSMPNVAMAGLSKEEALQQGLSIVEGKFAFETEAKSQIEKEDTGYLKFIVEKKSQKIIGISILHDEANAIAGEAALIVAQQLTLKDLVNTIHPHPTISESFTVLAKTMLGEIMLKKLENPVIRKLIEIERFL